MSVYYGSASRIPGRVFIGGACADGDQADPGADLSWVSEDLSHYLVRSAHLCVISDRGGAGALFATRASDKYDGRSVWAAGVSVVAGDELGYAHSIYEALNAGVTGATAPVHLSGDVSDGGVTWRFKERIMRTPMSAAIAHLQDICDGHVTWPLYVDTTQKPGASSMFSEWTVKAGQNVINDPFNPQPSQCALGLRWVAGGDASYAPSTHNVTAAMTFEKSSNSDLRWYSALVVGADAIAADGGAKRAIKLGPQHRQSWYVAAGQVGAEIWSEVTSFLERMNLVFWNRQAQIQCQGYPVASFETASAAGAVPDNYVSLIAQPAASGFVEVRARTNTGQADIDIKLTPKGNGRVRLGPRFALSGGEAVTGYIEVKDAAGVLRKLAVIE